MVGKNFRIYGVQIPRKCIESGHIYLCSPSNQSCLPSSPPKKRKITHSPEALLFRKSVSPTSTKAARGEGRRL